jgi:cytochrome P450
LSFTASELATSLLLHLCEFLNVGAVVQRLSKILTWGLWGWRDRIAKKTANKHAPLEMLDKLKRQYIHYFYFKEKQKRWFIVFLHYAYSLSVLKNRPKNVAVDLNKIRNGAKLIY